MQTANEYLKQLLTVVGQIENNQRKAGSEQKPDSGSKSSSKKQDSSGVTGALSGNLANIVNPFNNVKKKSIDNFFSFLNGFNEIADNTSDGTVKKVQTMSKSLTSLSTAMPALADGLSKLGGLRAIRVRSSVQGLNLLFSSMEEMGSTQRTTKVKRAIRTFNSMSKSLNKISKPIRSIANSLTAFAIGIVAFAGSMVVAGAILGTSSALAITAVVGMLASITGAFYLLSKSDVHINKGSKVTKEMGIGLGSLGLGLVAFAGSMALTGMLLGTSSVLAISSTVIMLASITGAFYLLSKVDKEVERGSEVAKNMSRGMGVLGLGLIAFAGSLTLAGILLGTSSALAISSTAVMLVAITGAFYLLSKVDKEVDKGSEVAANMGMGMGALGIGLVAFAGGLVLTGMLLGTTSGLAVASVVGMLISITGVFYLLGKAEDSVGKGSDVAKSMGMGMAVLSLGIVSFAITLAVLPLILGNLSEDGKGKSLLGSMAMLGGIVVASAGMFWLMGKMSDPIKKGSSVAVGMAIGMAALAGGVLALGLSAKFLMGGGLGTSGKTTEEKNDGMLRTLGGLGAIAGVIAASYFLFTALSASALLILPGIGVSLAMSIALIGVAYSTVKLVEASKKLEKVDVKDVIGNLVSATINGFLIGITPLSGTGGSFLSRTAAFIKNSAKIMGGVVVLSSMSVALSLFAMGISAFAELDNMRVIKGHKKDGTPIFGAKINIKNVSQNISTSIASFLDSLLTSTKGLTTSKSVALGVMARALTGKRGILGAVIQFTDVLKAYADFGPEGMIGYVDMIPDGVDEDGNAKFKQSPKKVSITKVTQNIADSFTQFVNSLVAKTATFKLSGEQGKKMMRLATILMGSGPYKVFGFDFGSDEPGLLEPITKFGDLLGKFAGMKDGQMPVFDENGNVIKGKYINTGTIATNIVKGLMAFTSKMGAEEISADTKKAEKNIGRFSNLMKRLNVMTNRMDGLDRFNVIIKDMATNIGSLSENLAKLNSSKLSDISKIGSAFSKNGNIKNNSNKSTIGTANLKSNREDIDSNKPTRGDVYLKKNDIYKNSNERIQKASYSKPNAVSSNIVSVQQQEQTKPSPVASIPAQVNVEQPDWNEIAGKIGEAVGTQIANAMKAGQMKFEFSSTGGNRGIIEFD